MDRRTTKPCHKNTMELKEPRRKRRVRIRPRRPFPIDIGSNNQWTVYTGHLSSLGICITNPYEMEALHSMGFFGKGSLSRSYPNFEKTRAGVPLVVRHRQWVRRQAWLDQAKGLDAQALIDDSYDQGWENIVQLDSKEQIDQDKPLANEEKKSRNGKNHGNNDVEISEVEEKLNPIQTETPQKFHKIDEKMGNVKVDEVVLGSSEEEDEICEITNIESTAMNTLPDKDIILLNDDEMLVDLGEKDINETESNLINTEDDIELLERDILVLPDSDSDIEDYLSKVKPTIEKEGFPVRETMYLTFEETFFLVFGLGCLQIIDFDGNIMSILDAWNHFCHIQKDFVQKYVVYHYFRSKGWVVKPGLKYGGDFLLYKQGPPFYHASYIVIVEVLDADTLIRNKNKTARKMTWKKLFGLDRLSETAAKEILFAQVLWPSKIACDKIPSTPELLVEFTVKELLYRRWIPKQKREEIDVDDNDELNE